MRSLVKDLADLAVGARDEAVHRLLVAWGQGQRGWTQLAQLKIAELDTRIADAQRAKELVEHALECPHRDLVACPNFRAAVEREMADFAQSSTGG